MLSRKRWKFNLFQNFNRPVHDRYMNSTGKIHEPTFDPKARD